MYRILILCAVLIGICTGAEFFSSLERDPDFLAIQAIQSSRVLINAVVYKFTEPLIFDALKEAHDRGVEIRLIADEVENKAHDSFTVQLQRYGAKVRFWAESGEYSKLHAKFSVYDNTTAICGSANWSKGASEDNMELMVFTTNVNDCQQLTVIFNSMWRMAIEIEDIPPTQL